MTIDIATLKSYISFDKLVAETKGLYTNQASQLAAFILADGDNAKALEILMTKTTEEEDKEPDSVLSQMSEAVKLVLDDEYIFFDHWHVSPEERRARRAAARAENRAARAAYLERVEG